MDGSDRVTNYCMKLCGVCVVIFVVAVGWQLRQTAGLRILVFMITSMIVFVFAVGELFVLLEAESINKRALRVAVMTIGLFLLAFSWLITPYALL